MYFVLALVYTSFKEGETEEICFYAVTFIPWLPFVSLLSTKLLVINLWSWCLPIVWALHLTLGMQSDLKQPEALLSWRVASTRGKFKERHTQKENKLQTRKVLWRRGTTNYHSRKQDQPCAEDATDSTFTSTNQINPENRDLEFTTKKSALYGHVFHTYQIIDEILTY